MLRLLGKIFKFSVRVFRNGGLCIGHEMKHRLRRGGDQRNEWEIIEDIKRRLGLDYRERINVYDGYYKARTRKGR